MCIRALFVLIRLGCCCVLCRYWNQKSPYRLWLNKCEYTQPHANVHSTHCRTNYRIYTRRNKYNFIGYLNFTCSTYDWTEKHGDECNALFGLCQRAHRKQLNSHNSIQKWNEKKRETKNNEMKKTTLILSSLPKQANSASIVLDKNVCYTENTQLLCARVYCCFCCFRALQNHEEKKDVLSNTNTSTHTVARV